MQRRLPASEVLTPAPPARVGVGVRAAVYSGAG
jgi:hypothetical protein